MTDLIKRRFSAHPWAMTEDWLFLMAEIMRRKDARDLGAEAPDYIRRDYLLAAGPGAQKLSGASRAFVVDGVAVIPVSGPIFPGANMMTEMSGATSVMTFKQDYRLALASNDVGAILLQMNTPGGQVPGIAATAQVLASGAKVKRTIAHVDGMAASAGYWLASQAGEIVVDRTASVGSIGVVTAVPVQVAPDAGGNQWIEIVSANAPNKRPSPLTEDGMAEIVAHLNAIETEFVADVASGRKTSVETVRAGFGRGGMKVGADAVKAGMADRVASYDATLTALVRDVARERRMQQLRQA